MSAIASHDAPCAGADAASAIGPGAALPPPSATPNASVPPPWTAGPPLFALVSVAYSVAAALSFLLVAEAEKVAVFWPASGVAVGALLALGSAVRVPVAAGVGAATIAANLYQGAPLELSASFAVANIVECLLVAALAERFAGVPYRIDRVRNVLVLALAAMIGAVPAAALAATAIVGLGRTEAVFHEVLSVWLLSDLVGIVAVAPAAVGVRMAYEAPPTRRETIVGLVLLMTLALATYYLLSRPAHSTSWPATIPAAVLFPLVLLIAALCRPVFAASASIIICAVVVLSATAGQGVFASADLVLSDRVVAAQFGMLAVSLCALTMAALFARSHAAEDALRRKEAHLEFALEAARLGYWQLELETGIMTGSERALSAVGARRQGSGIALVDLLDAVHETDRPVLLGALDRARQTGAALDVELRAIGSDRSVRWLKIMGQMAEDEAGRRNCIHGIASDITSRRASEQALSRSEQRQRLALEAAELGTWQLDTANGRMSFDERSWRHFALSLDTSFEHLLAVVHPEDRSALSALRFAARGDAGSARRQATLECRIALADGGWRWLRLHARAAEDEVDGTPRTAQLFGTSQDITDRKRAEARQVLLGRELDHRVKNMLAVIEVMIDRTREVEGSADRLAASLKGRIRSMSRTHEKLAQAQWSGIELATIVEDELAAYRTAHSVLVSGGPVTLPPDVARTLTMTLHELATNAAKHGAWSAAGGWVAVCWRVERAETGGGGPRLHISWQERGGPPIGDPVLTPDGYGTAIIRELIRHEVGGDVRLDFASDGVRCEMVVPLSATGPSRHA